MDDAVEYELWIGETVNNLLQAAEGFRQMALHCPEGTEVGRMIHNIDMLLAEAELWRPDGAEWPKNETTAVIFDFETKRRVN